MKFTIGRKLGLGIGVILMFLGVMALVSYNSLTTTIGAYRDVATRVDVAMEQARRLDARVQEQAASIPSYLVTGNSGYRQQYDDNGAKAEEALGILKTLIQNADGKLSCRT